VAEVGSNWYDGYLAPGIIIVVVIAIVGWFRSYLSGKKSNIKEAQTLATQTVEKAEAKDIQEKKDAKLLELEKTTAATVLKKDAKEEAIEVKKESREFINNRFKFTDQEHASQHAELRNEVNELRNQILQLCKDFEEHKKRHND
jgi:uncharacterized membrane protein YhiD involved in acid resistance